MKAQALRIVGYVAALVLTLWALDCSSRTEGGNTARTEAAERSAAIVAQAYRTSRDRTDTVVVTVVRQGARVDTAVAETRAAIDSARAVLAETSELPIETDLGVDANAANKAIAEISANKAIAELSASERKVAIVRLRASLGELTVRAERLVAEAVVYRAQVDSLTVRLAEERAAAQVTLDAKDAVIRSLKAERCTIAFGVRCPTRTQAAIAGSLITLAAVVSLR